MAFEQNTSPQAAPTREADPGVRTGPIEQDEAGQGSDTPVAGDVDPGATRSAEETGQAGDPGEPKKETGNPWNG